MTSTETMAEVVLGDCREQIAEAPDASFDAVITDPPYEIQFLNREWDGTGIAYDSAFWGECLRVLKPGGYLLSFGACRTMHRITCAIEDANFEIRDVLQWLFGSGMPKSFNLGKKSGDPKLEGWGTNLKPAYEPITMARKPVKGTTITKNAIEHGTGGINVDGGRTPEGRWPANVVIDDFVQERLEAVGKYFYCAKASRKEREAGCEHLEEWNLAEEVHGSTDKKAYNNTGRAGPGASAAARGIKIHNGHPCVKPVELMRWLCRLVVPEGGIILDPFAGSGTTGVAAVLEGFHFLGVEMDEKSQKVAQARIEHARG